MEAKRQPVIWLQGAGCTGCSVSIMNSVSPSIKNLLVDEVVPGSFLQFVFHPTLMATSGEVSIRAMLDTREKKEGSYILVMEGGIPTARRGIFGTVGEKEGEPVTILSRFVDLARGSLAIIAVGDCATFGGIPAGRPNPTGCKGAKNVVEEEEINVPVINVPGCPPHPDWFVGTVAHILLCGLMSGDDLDELNRPKTFYGQIVHENCPRRPYFDEGKFARQLGEEGCLYELGCKGPFTYADCPIRHWNGGVNWVIGAGSPCLGCTEPSFPDITGPFYKKIGRWEELKPSLK